MATKRKKPFDHSIKHLASLSVNILKQLQPKPSSLLMATKKNKNKGLSKKEHKKAKTNRSKTPRFFWKSKNHLIPLFIILSITFFVFFPSLQNDFVNWDDDLNILDNPNLSAFDWYNIKGIFTSTVIGGYNPLTIFTFAVEKSIFGLEPFVFHFNNLLLHLGCMYFVFRIMLALKLSRNAAILATILFAIHPMRVESVAWATERKDVLFGIFYLAAMFNYIKYLTQKQQNFLTYTLILFVLSLFSKIQAVAFPLSMLALDYYFNRPLEFKRITEKWLFFLLALIVGSLGIYFLTDAKTIDLESTQFTLFERFFIGAYSFCIYLVKFIFPYEMSPLYPYPVKLSWTYFAAPLGFITFAYTLYVTFKKNQRAIVFGLLFFFFNIMFMLQILGAGQGFKADRFSYIPYLGLFFILAYFYDFLLIKKKLKTQYLHVILGVYILVFMAMTWQQCGIWKNGNTLWSHVLKHYDQITTPYGNRGHYWRNEGNSTKAIADYNRAIQIKEKAVLYNSRGKTYFDMGNTEQAIKDYSRGIQLDRNEAELYVNRASAYGKSGNYTKALTDANKGLALDPTLKNAYFTKSMIHMSTQDYSAAIDAQNSYLKLDPYDAETWYERGICKRLTEQYQSALSDFNQAIKLKQKKMYYLERAKIYNLMERNNEAKLDEEKARSLAN